MGCSFSPGFRYEYLAETTLDLRGLGHPRLEKLERKDWAHWDHLYSEVRVTMQIMQAQPKIIRVMHLQAVFWPCSGPVPALFWPPVPALFRPCSGPVPAQYTIATLTTQRYLECSRLDA